MKQFALCLYTLCVALLAASAAHALPLAGFSATYYAGGTVIEHCRLGIPCGGGFDTSFHLGDTSTPALWHVDATVSTAPHKMTTFAYTFSTLTDAPVWIVVLDNLSRTAAATLTAPPGYFGLQNGAHTEIAWLTLGAGLPVLNVSLVMHGPIRVDAFVPVDVGGVGHEPSFPGGWATWVVAGPGPQSVPEPGTLLLLCAAAFVMLPMLPRKEGTLAVRAVRGGL